MILVTIGSEKFPFNRLMQWIDNLIDESVIPTTEPVIVKYSSCLFIASQADYYSLLPENKLSKLITEARLIISDCSEENLNLLAKATQPLILIVDNYDKDIDQNQVVAEQLIQKGILTASTQADLAKFLVAHTHQLKCR
jgi:UDP-N-acetylglucosamine transferase subunit ALG13